MSGTGSLLLILASVCSGRPAAATSDSAGNTLGELRGHHRFSTPFSVTELGDNVSGGNDP
jgi:hypothetical protein